MKYFYWSVRPITAIWRLNADGTALSTEAQCAATPSLCPNRNVWYSIIGTPGFPSYPSGHSSFSGGAGRVLTYFFPKAGESLNLLANQAASSRLYGGIHFDEDNRDGLILGRAIADLAIARAKADGAG
jgi:membrane-associated phospholipid phosphatase